MFPPSNIPPPDGMGTYQLPGIGFTPGLLNTGLNPPGILPNVPPPNYTGINQNIPLANNYTPPNSANPPLDAHGIVGPAGSQITTPQSQGSNGFLDVVGGALGAIISKAGDILGAPEQYIAKPITETLLHPDVFYDDVAKQMGSAFQFGRTRGQQGSINPFDINQILAAQLDQNDDPGLVKFAGETLFDPLTWMSSGVLKGAQTAVKAERFGAAGLVAAKALDPAIAGMTKYEQATDAAVGSVSSFIGKAVNANSVAPLIIAKDNARGVLNKVLPEGLTEKILSSVPEEYSGINISPISRAFPQYGLPDVISMPQYRSVAVLNARNKGYEFAHQAIADLPFQPLVSSHMQSLYAAPTESLTEDGAFVQDILKRPSVFSAQDISKLSSAVGGNLHDPTDLHVLDFNNIVSQYRRGPSISGTPDGIDLTAGLDGVAAALGADLSNNPKAGETILKVLKSKDDESLNYIDKLSQMPRQDMLNSISMRAGQLADEQFTSGIQQQRINNTIFDQFLNKADNVYDYAWRQKLQGINRFINTFDVMTLGMPFMQVAEARLRHTVEGAGVLLNDVDPEVFRTIHANGPLPPPLRQGVLHPYIDSMEKSILQRIGGENNTRPVLGWLANKEEQLSNFQTNSIMAAQRSYYNTTWDANFKAAADAAGTTVRPDMQAFYDAAASPDVNNTPELQGIPQSFVNGYTSAGVKMVGNQDAIDAFKATQQANQINRYALSHIADSDVAMNGLGASPRALLRQGLLRGEPTPAAHADLLDKVIEQQKTVLQNSPQVKADMFEGALNSLEKAGQSPLFSPRNLNDTASQVLSMQSQYADMSNLIRKGEYDSLNNALRGANGYRTAIHDEADQRILEASKRIDPILTRGYAILNDQGAKLGIADHTMLITNAMEQDRQLLAKTWADDASFRKAFFSTNPDRNSMLTWDDPINGYYPMRQRIWDGFGTQHQANVNKIMQGQLAMSQALLDRQAAGLISGDVNTIGAVTSAAKQSLAEVTPEEIAASSEHPFVQESRQRLNDAQVQYAASGSEDDFNMMQAEQMNLDENIARFSGDTSSDIFKGIIEDGFSKGNTADEITRQINTAITPSEGNANPESILDPSSESTQSQISGAISNDTAVQSGNASSTIPTQPDPNDFLSAQYSNLDSTVRPGLEQLIGDKIANPAITDDALNYMHGWLDKLQGEFNSVPQDGQKILNDVAKTTYDRTNQMFGQAFTNYSGKTNFDQMMLHFFPWWMHESRRWPWLTRTFLGKPTTVSMWEAYQDQTNQGYVPISEIPLVGGLAKTFIPGGDSWQVNPTRFITPFNPIQPTNQFRPTQYTEGLAGLMQGVDKVLSQVGFSPSNLFDIPQAMAQGQIGAEIPGIGKSALNIARASNVPGLSQVAASIQNALPDNFRDYYTRMILASNGFEPDQVYDDALGGDETAKNSLDVAQQQSSLVSAVLAQTGVLRYRTPSYSAYQNQRMQAVESMVGIPVAVQQEMRNDGVSVRQIQAFSPMQREELANLPGAQNWNEITEPMLNPAARKLRDSQREFFKTLDTERDEVNVDQTRDDRRLQGGLISGVEWRKRYQDRAGTLSTLIDDMKKTPAYKDVPLSMDEQTQARARFNLPVYVQSPVDVALNEYYSVKPVTDVVTGDTNWGDYFAQKQAVLDKHPQLKELLDAKIAKNSTPQVQDFKKSAEILRPYFSIKDEILKQHPDVAALVEQAQLIQNEDPVKGRQFRENNDQLSALNTMVRHMQQQARRSFPQIDQALVKYYGAQPIQIKSLAGQNQTPQPRQIPEEMAAI